ncbi:MAG: hypothetical protein PHT12_03380 [Patescibacteria group bacterium]|nr:hypothetical protein [Patescibacteria group bacterium]
MRYACQPKTITGKRGAVLLFALLVLSQVIVSSVGLGTLILNAIQQARYIDESIAAYYAAETGAEEALYELRREHRLPEQRLNPQLVENSATWTRLVSPTEPTLTFDLARDSFVEIDLFDPDKPSEALAPPNDIASILLTWPENTCQSGACPHLVASLVAWDPLNFNTWSEEASSVQRVSASFSGLTLSNLSDRQHRLRLRAEDGDFRQLTVAALNGVGNQALIPGRAVIRVSGQYGGAVQTIQVRAPRHAPLSSIFDFAIFSECSVVKGFPIRCP